MLNSGRKRYLSNNKENFVGGSLTHLNRRGNWKLIGAGGSMTLFHPLYIASLSHMISLILTHGDIGIEKRKLVSLQEGGGGGGGRRSAENTLSFSRPHSLEDCTVSYYSWSFFFVWTTVLLFFIYVQQDLIGLSLNLLVPHRFILHYP